MSFILKMPKLSPTMEEGRIVKWHKKEGDLVKEGELLFEVATDKASVEYNVLDGGYLRKILVPEGSDAAINTNVAIFSESQDEDISSLEQESAATSATAESGTPSATEGSSEAASNSSGKSIQTVDFEPFAPLEDYQFGFTKSDAEKKASPLAKKIAQEEGISLTDIQGSGPAGRVMSRDLERGTKNSLVPPKLEMPPKHQPGSFRLEPMTPMRKAIASKLQASKTFIPHFYVEQEIDADAMVSLRAQLKSTGVKVTYNDFIMRAAALCSRAMPNINSGFNSKTGEIIRFETVDLAVAVSINEGLITPIVRHSDYKTLFQISAEVRQLASLAKEGKLKPEQYQGGSLTISNLGMFGVTRFIPIINPPQACILSVGGMYDVAKVSEGQIVPGKKMSFTLASDHRVIDGADAAKFLQMLKQYLENPVVLIAAL